MNRRDLTMIALGALMTVAGVAGAQTYQPLSDMDSRGYEVTYRASPKHGVRFQVYARGTWRGVERGTPKEILHSTFDIDTRPEIDLAKACVDLGMGKLFLKTGKPGW